jgi:hypothetical protein
MIENKRLSKCVIQVINIKTIGLITPIRSKNNNYIFNFLNNQGLNNLVKRGIIK